MSAAFPPPDQLVYVALGGAGEIGMNLYLYGTGGKWIAVDCGITFGDEANPTIDVVMADPKFIEERREDLLAVLLTHGHEDHLGAIPYIGQQLGCPVYATPFTASFLKHKLEEEGQAGKVEVIEVPLGGVVDLAPFTVRYLGLTHSIPEPNALAITTPLGTVLHTGDYKFDPTPLVGEVADEDGLKDVGDHGVLALIGDSTNVMKEGDSGSEGAVRDSLVELFGRYDGRIIVTCFASNIARMESIAVAAKANGRHVALIGRSLWRMNTVARANGYLTEAEPFLSDEEGAYLPAEKVLYLCTGSQGEPRAALNRVAFDSHRHVVVGPGDVVIFSSRTIPGNEKSVLRLQNQLVRRGIEIVTDRDAFVHVSGHPCRDEVRRMYGLIRPKVAVPIHGERMHLTAHAALAEECGAEAILAENGQMVKLAPGEPEIIGEVETGRLALEGQRLVSLDSRLLRDRKKSIYGGAAVLTLVVDRDGEIVGDPQLSAPGLLDEEDDPDDWDDLLDDVCDAVDDLSNKDRRKDDKVSEAARLAVRRALSQVTGRKPMVTVHLVRV